MYHTDDTIAAIASAPEGSARGIIRISGPAVPAILSACFQPAGGEQLICTDRASARRGTVSLQRPRARRLDAEVYLWPEGRSYTRQTSAELHTIGSPPLLSAALQAVCAAGARAAEPGEFTLRAFLAGRLDLTQAEGVLGVIDARGDEQLRQSLGQLAGNLARPLGQLRDSLLDLLAHLEAGLDFVEEDIEFVTRQQLDEQIQDALTQVERIADQLAKRRRSDAAPRVVLVGSPNVGKSSLFNALANRCAALVSDRPGTTRDYLTARLDLGGQQCELIDTAGHESAHAAIASAARDFAASQAASGDLVCLCLDATRPTVDWEREQLATVPAVPRLIVWTKCDRGRPMELPTAVATSAHTGQGLDELRGVLSQVLAHTRGESAASLTAERCGASLQAAGESLRRAGALIGALEGEELIASELRLALGQLGQVVGAVYTDDILDRVFSRFCIGK